MKNNKKGFTLAEIIISMTIIGVIAAITIPALLVSTSEKALEAQKKALRARMSQAISQIEDLRAFEKSASGADKSSALNFITLGLSKVYRISKTCDKNNLVKNCNFPDEISLQNGDTFKIKDYLRLSLYLNNSSIVPSLDTEVAGFKTANGESIALYYNPRCYGAKTNSLYTGNAFAAMCINMIYDLNGAAEAPNEVGKDVGFISIFFPKDADIVLPVSYGADVTESFSSYQTAVQACKKQDNSLIVPNLYDGMSIALNKIISGIDNSSYLISATGSTSVYKLDVSTLSPEVAASFSGLKLRCEYNN